MLEILQQEASSKPGRLDPRLKSQVCADVSINRNAVAASTSAPSPMDAKPNSEHAAFLKSSLYPAIGVALMRI